MFFLGIDGGGTKTAFLLINENGDIIEAKTIATVSYKHVGMDNSIALLKETVHEIFTGSSVISLIRDKNSPSPSFDSPQLGRARQMYASRSFKIS